MAWHPRPSDKSIANWGVDVALSAFFAGIGLLAIVDSQRLGAGWASDGPQSGYFPFLIGSALLVASLINLVTALRSRGSSGTFVTWEQFQLVLVMVAPTALFVVAIPLIGIYVSSAILAIAFLRVLGGYSWLGSILFGVLVAVTAFWMFDVWFLVPLPKGPLEHALGY
jgi:putative tricarboxylic transport membrane protein